MKITENIDLKGLNSFGVGARAACLAEWETAGELAGFFAANPRAEWMPLGAGNNILFTKDYPGTLIRSAGRSIGITGETADTLAVRVDAGADWNDFVEWCTARGVWGAENLSGIPGSVGACPIQNIGAYGAEAASIISSVECFCVDDGKTLTLAAAHCGFGYRDSVFKRALKGRVVITAVDFVLSKKPEPNLCYDALAVEVEKTGGPTLENISRAVRAIRDSKLPDPKVTGNAGSFFKNPVVDADFAHRLAGEYPGMPLYPSGTEGMVKLAAGWLIDRAGWRGRSEGRAGIHPRQALVVVNLGGASGDEIARFAERVRNDVESKFGVRLETEVNIL